jgi:hypothetical protein
MENFWRGMAVETVSPSHIGRHDGFDNRKFYSAVISCLSDDASNAGGKRLLLWDLYEKSWHSKSQLHRSDSASFLVNSFYDMMIEFHVSLHK